MCCDKFDKFIKQHNPFSLFREFIRYLQYKNGFKKPRPIFNNTTISEVLNG